MTSRIPLPPRAMGRRGGVLALALWGAASTATSHADDLRTADPTDTLIIEVAEEPPAGDIYGGPPDDRGDKKPIAALWAFPSDLQGYWSAPKTSLTVESDRYVLTRDAATETGRIGVLPTGGDKKGEITLRVQLSERVTSDGKTQPDVVEVWVLTSDLKTLKTADQTLARVVIEAPPVNKYGLPPSLDD